jgi:hypothetical protein
MASGVHLKGQGEKTIINESATDKAAKKIIRADSISNFSISYITFNITGNSAASATTVIRLDTCNNYSVFSNTFIATQAAGVVSTIANILSATCYAFSVYNNKMRLVSNNTANASMWGITQFECYQFTVENNVIINLTTQGLQLGIGVFCYAVTCFNASVIGNTIVLYSSNAVSYGIQALGTAAGGGGPFYVTYCTFSGNSIRNTFAGLNSTGIIIDNEADRNVASSNVIQGCAIGIRINNVNCDRNVINNNILTNNTTPFSDAGTATINDNNQVL